MSQSTTSQETLFSPHASLAALITQLSVRGIFDTVRQEVHIAQKTVKNRHGHLWVVNSEWLPSPQLAE